MIIGLLSVAYDKGQVRNKGGVSMYYRYVSRGLLRAGLWIGLILLILFPSLTLPGDILAKRDGHKLMTTQVAEMIEVGEHIAQQRFSAEEKQALTSWAIDLFSQDKELNSVISAFTRYTRYLKLAAQQIDTERKLLVWHHLYREMVFKWRFPRFQEEQLTLLDIIQRYNPPLRKLEQEQLLLAKKDVLLSEQGDYFFSGPMWTALQWVTEFLARSPITPDDEKGLQQWALADFANSPQRASKVYAAFFDVTLSHAMLPQSRYAQEQYRKTLFQKYYFIFRDDIFSQRWDRDIMDVALKHNPVLVIDEQNRVVLSHSEWQDVLAAIRFFSTELGLQHDVSAVAEQAERQRLISQFMQRTNPQQSLANSVYLLRSQALWRDLSDVKRKEMSKLIKHNYQQQGDIWLALQPLFVHLDRIIQRENQQQMLEQQLLAGVLMRQLGILRSLQKRSLQSYRELGRSRSMAIADQSLRHSIGLTGGEILETHKDHFYVENERGERYTIMRSP